MASTQLTKTIAIDQIVIPKNRIRRKFDEERLEELANSIAGNNRLGIKPKGLLHPIVLAWGDDLSLELVAGESRLRAIDLLHKRGKEFTHEGSPIPKGHIPYTMLGDLDPDARREAELEENTIRTDLSWQEVQLARAELHKLRVSQHGEYSHSTKEGWSMLDTKRELGLSDNTKDIRDALVLADHLDDEDVAKAKTKEEALKVLKKKNIEFLTKELAKHYDEDGSEKPFDFRNTDMVEGILSIPDKSFDCIVTDPPYGIEADSFGSQTAHGHKYEDTKEYVAALMEIFIPESYRILKEQAHLYMFCDFNNFHHLSRELQAVGYDVWPRPIIWSKKGGMLPVPDYGPRYTYECIIFANKGKRPVTAVYGDVVDVSSVDGKLTIHAAQKPVEVYVDLIKRCCNPGDEVFDAFVGSGTLFEAAKICKVKATGFEKSETMYAKALVSLKE